MHVVHVCKLYQRATVYAQPWCKRALYHRGTAELQSLLYGPRMNEKRETLFEDRTRCHADHVGKGQDTTAAVGVLKAVKFGDER